MAALRGGLVTGLPEPPAIGASALPAGTFEGQVVLVTGGGTGLGKAIAIEFARLGAAVAVVSRDPDHQKAGVEAVEQAGGKAFATGCDIRDAGQVAAAFDAVTDALGLPGVLVNNAAGNFPVPAEDLSPNGWRAVTQIVLDGTFFCSREFGRRHIVAGTSGAIVNIGASYAWTGGPGFAHSSAAKAAVKNLTETLAVEWAPYGIRINCLVPGWAATFLASPYASYVTGATLAVDGANWQRRHMLMPEFRPIREQLGKEPFSG
jgi:NAD(P)-dependent dehydrogenase (short-subunit alcohol dehydrogenase family)